MKTRRSKIIAVLLALVFLLPLLPACSGAAPAPESYLVMVPAVLQPGSEQSIPVTFFRGDQPVPGRVEISLLQDGRVISTTMESLKARGSVRLSIPSVPDGDYAVRIKGEGFEDQATVRVENRFLLFLETDKPIYKPGQTIRIRALTLSADLRPVSQPVTVEALDARGIRVFRTTLNTDDFGMGNTDLPLSTEPNLGAWKLIGLSANATSQLDVRVEEYVLPKYEVKVDLPRDWFLVSEPVTGKITAEYSFGKPVKGELRITALKYVGQWQQYATFTKDIDGAADFTLPAVGYVAGVPAAGGMGNIQLDVSVVERSTGYQEKTSRLLTVAQSSTNLQIIPSGTVFKPGLPFRLMLVTQTPDKKLIDAKVQVNITYYDKDFKEAGKESETASTIRGKALVDLTPPAAATAMVVNCSGGGGQATKTIAAGYSPSGNFINLEQTSTGTLQVGDEVWFRVTSTDQAANFYYEVISHGRVVFSDYTRARDIVIRTTPAMAPSARVLVYQVLPNSEVAADYLPFQVDAQYPNNVRIDPGVAEARPGDNVTISIQTDGQSAVGLAAVDRSVFILAENRVNLQQVFDQLEQLYMKPQAELHEVNIYEGVTTPGAQDVFKNAGVVIMSNKLVSPGKEYKNPRPVGKVAPLFQDARGGVMVAQAAPPSAPSAQAGAGQLADVQRVRQFFPETWLWQQLKTDIKGNGSVEVKAPDTITTWMLRAVAMSKTTGLGIAESQLKVFQPFFLTVDLPYSAVRGEEFPVRVAIYNYLDRPQTVQVQIDPADWFDLLDDAQKSISIAGNDTGGASFKIRPGKLGTGALKIMARSTEAADAVIKTIIVDPEGVPREIVDNIVLNSGVSKTLSTAIPSNAVAGSGRAYLALTASYLTQTVNGLEGLLQMPFGCGEQNMIVFAPDVYITRYLRASRQLKPEIMAKAEKLMITGYQRELTYRRSDGSFSAFGQSDSEGSLWLTGFVMKSFAQARDIIYVDQAVLDAARSWITARQNADGSFDQVGFVHHQEMIGGLKGKTALTAYTAIALMQAGDKTNSARAVSYLEEQLSGLEDPYAVAITACALELGKSARAAAAHDKLMKLAKEDDNGLYWGGTVQPLPQPLPAPGKPGLAMPGIMPPLPNRTADIETTAYAMLALVRHGDVLNAGRAARWLTSKRNAYGGYGSTQDTVVALEALVEQATGAKSDVDLTVQVQTASSSREIKIRPDNFDILQMVEVPVGPELKVTAQGKGEAIAQLVLRFSEPQAKDPKQQVIQIDVVYDTTDVAVNDLVKVSVALAFNPPLPMEAGMIVADISVPTGFQAVRDSIDRMLKNTPQIKRYDIAGRKVIFYVQNMKPGDKLSFSFSVQAMYPVKAKGVTSQAYSYYQPEVSGETLGKNMVVREK